MHVIHVIAMYNNLNDITNHQLIDPHRIPYLTADILSPQRIFVSVNRQGQAGILGEEVYLNQTVGLTDSQRIHSRGFTNNAFTGSAPHVNSDDLLSSNDTSQTTWDLKISWLLSNIISDAAPVVTIVFFTALYPNINPHPSTLSLEDTNVHALNFVFVIIDHMISARPVKLYHAVFPFVYGLGYIIFSIIYWSTDHVNHVVYPILDWNSPGIAMATTVGLCCVAIPLLQLFFFGFYRLKYHIFKTVYGYDL